MPGSRPPAQSTEPRRNFGQSRPEVDGRIKVDIKGTVTSDLLAAVQTAGGTIIASLPGYDFLQAVVPVENIEGLAARNDVRFIGPARKAHQNYVDSEGDYTHQAIQTRANYPANGAGIKVGILSDSIDNGTGALTAAITGGNIDATNTFVIPGQAGTGEGEGLAMRRSFTICAQSLDLFCDRFGGRGANGVEYCGAGPCRLPDYCRR